MKEYTKDKT